jgi:hypothetical protein
MGSEAWGLFMTTTYKFGNRHCDLERIVHRPNFPDVLFSNEQIRCHETDLLLISA